MTPEVWQRVKSLVGDALEQPDNERSAFVSKSGEATTVRREAQSILAQSAARLEACVEHVTATVTQDTSLIGRRIGAYRILRDLGRGGMGAVYLAERADGAFEKTVAIKILKRGTDTDEVLRRFRSERQILARLNHPNIAGLLDAGETGEGLPYFVMEYVDGKPITKYANDQLLPISRRLELFRIVCSAVGYAHQNLVIHRDLKPSNVLVAENGEVKLLDFGIAKLVQESEPDVTLTIHRVMTPEYASPEQVKGEPITTVSDVYSLGVLLYELLTDERPYKLKTRSQDEITKAIREQEPERPSTAVARSVVVNPQSEIRNPKFLRGDLDNIVLKALRKEPQRRYVSVDQFSADIRRYLEGLPVRARRDTPGYRASKFVRRHRLSVSAAALTVLALLGGFIATTWEAHNAHVERARAERRFNDVRKIANSLMFEFHDSIKNLPGALAARQLITRRAVEYLDSLAQEAGSDLSLKSELANGYSKIGHVTFDVQQAIATHRKAVALNESLVRAEPKNAAYQKQLAESYSDLSDQMKISENSEQSIDYARRSLAVTQTLAGDHPGDNIVQIALANQYLDLGIALRDPGDTKEALPNDLKAMEILRAIIARDSLNKEALHDLAGVYGELADAYNDLAEDSTALDYARKEMDAARDNFAVEPTNARYRRDMWSADFHLARERAATGDVDAALANYAEAQALIESLSSADPADTGHKRWLALTYSALADLLAATNRWDRAMENYEKAISISKQLVASDPQRAEARRDLVKMYDDEALLIARAGHNKRALEVLNRALPLAQENANHDSQNARVKARLAKLYIDIGNINSRLSN